MDLKELQKFVTRYTILGVVALVAVIIINLITKRWQGAIAVTFTMVSMLFVYSILVKKKPEEVNINLSSKKCDCEFSDQCNQVRQFNRCLDLEKGYNFECCTYELQVRRELIESYNVTPSTADS